MTRLPGWKRSSQVGSAESDLLVSRKEFQESLSDIKVITTNFSSMDILSEYRMDKHGIAKIGSRIRDKITACLGTILGTEEFRSEVITKPQKNVKDIRIRSSPVFEVAKIEKLKTASLKYLGAFELSKHSSHHVMSSCMINGVFLATGHADSSLKIWSLNPKYFETSFTSHGQKRISSNEIAVSGTGSGTSANFKKKDVTELRPDSQVQPLEIEWTSPQDFHKHFVTSIAFTYRKKCNDMYIVSGDSSGEMVVSELNYSQVARKVDSVSVVFRRRAHKGQISKIETTQFEDVVVTAGHDCFVM